MHYDRGRHRVHRRAGVQPASGRAITGARPANCGSLTGVLRRQTMRRSLVPVLMAIAALSACNDRPREAATASPAAAPAAAAVPAPALQGSYGVYVTNEMSGNLTVIDPVSNTAIITLPLGKRPRGIKASPDGGRLFVALSGSPSAPPGVDEKTLPPPDRTADGIGVVDTRSFKLTTILKGPSDPEQLSVSHDGQHLYVANEDSGKASVLEADGGKAVTELAVGGEPEGVTTSPDGRFVYVTSEEDGQISVIDTNGHRVLKRFKVGARPRNVAFSPDSSRAYVTAENGGTVSVVNVSQHRVIQTIKLTGENVRPMGVAVSPDGRRLFVTTGRGGSVIAIDTATGRPVGSVAVGARPWGIAVSPDGSRLFTANGPSNDVSVVDTATLTVVQKIPAGDRPWGVITAPVSR
jgi:YVTN family beta-propeller protein